MIRKLPPHIVNQIAAGEVVERPGAVVKELIENALDAAASKVAIEYEEGGLKRLVIEDDGAGIAEADFEMAIEAHATSKIENFEDLDHLNSFGFRGEALASIAAVAELEIWSSTANDNVGRRQLTRFGKTEQVEAADRRVGTRVFVRDLFLKHPARLKFMKSARSEAIQILQIWKKYVLAYPEKSWSLKETDSKRHLQVAKQSELDRVLWYFGGEDEDQWISVKKDASPWKMRGYALKPRMMGKIKSGIMIYLNRRPIRDTKLEFAVRRAFEGFTENPREISAVVFLEGSAEHFDVNVHPTKSEVRFLELDTLFSLVTKAFREELDREHLALPKLADFWSQKALANEMRSSSLRQTPLHEIRETPSVEKNPAISEAGMETSIAVQAFSHPIASFEPESHFEYLGSLDDTYLISKRGAELFLFDQHALHERVLYERLLKEFQTGERLSSQRLLFPLRLDFENAEVLPEKEGFLEKLGFEVRPWADGKWQLVAAPSILKRGHQEILMKLIESEELASETMVRDILATIACHSAVRAHDRLQKPEIERLLKDFQSEDSLGHCPHGRPTFLRYQVKDLEKLFHRVL